MGNKAGKIWGSTELIEANGSCEFHKIDFIKGGTCSKHKHEYKWNGFYVVSGEMKIRVWQKDYDLIDETILKAGDYTAVKPGLYHSFEGLEDGVAEFRIDMEFESMQQLDDAMEVTVVDNDVDKKHVGFNQYVNVDTIQHFLYRDFPDKFKKTTLTEKQEKFTIKDIVDATKNIDPEIWKK
jgi:quercetin dioxygenase-like cupin family protein